MEKIQNIIENNLSDSKKFETLKGELLDYQFQYIEKLHDGTLKPLHSEVSDYKETFKDLILECTDLRQYLTNEYCKKMGDAMYHNEEERNKYNEWYNTVIKEVIASYDLDNKNYRNNLNQIFKVNLEKLTPINETENNYLKNENHEKRAGLLHFNTVQAMNEFSDYGINEGDDCISIHFKDLVDQKKQDNSISNLFSNNSLSQLAVKIVEEYPQTKAIIAESWIVDSPIGKRIGFIPTKKIDDVVQDTRFWGQFINEKGEINKGRIKKFLETGVPEYCIKDGLIKVEDFLKKYLPKEKRGLIQLKERKDESSKFKKEREKVMGKFENEFDKSSYEELHNLLKESILVDFFKTSDGLEMLEFIKKTKEENAKRLDVIKDERFLQFKNNFRKFCDEKENQFIEREVMIE